MKDFILLYHRDGTSFDPALIGAYIDALRKADAFVGGSAIGSGGCYRKAGEPGPIASHIGGFMRVRATDLAAAERLLAGNPTYEAGGTVEIRELPRT